MYWLSSWQPLDSPSTSATLGEGDPYSLEFHGVTQGQLKPEAWSCGSARKCWYARPGEVSVNGLFLVGALDYVRVEETLFCV